MTTGIDIATLTAARPLQTPTASANASSANKAAKQFESVFISEFLGQMFADIPTDGPFGGGEGEQMFRSLMIDQYGNQIEKQGGFGLSAPIAAHLLKLQEARK
jgi:Rod binding domain-containing protein